MRIEERYAVIERPDANLRVLFLHHGGGSAMSFLALARRVPTMCEPVLFELPGRGTRAEEPPAPDFAAAQADLAAAAEHLTTLPLVIVGQSLGGLLAHGLAVRLAQRANANVRAVVLASCVAPSVVEASASWPDRPFLVRSRSDVKQQLRTTGGCDPEIFDEPDFLAATVELLGNDLHLADTYRAPAQNPGPIEYHIWSGSLDPNVSPESLIGWRDAALHAPMFRQFVGGHILFRDEQPQAALYEMLARHANDTLSPSGDAP